MNRPYSLCVVRHGESERNEAKKGSTYFADDEARSIVRGIPDEKVELTPRGVLQAKETGLVVRQKYGVFDYVYHSGFKRTEKTMEGILAAYTDEERARMRIRMNPHIYERHSGFTYDMTQEEAERNFPWLQTYWATFGGYFAQPPGGESLAQVADRVYLFINMLFRDRAGENILIVTHGGVIRCIRFILEHWTFDQAKAWLKGQAPENCGVTVYNFNKNTGRMELEAYNQVFWTKL